MKSLQVTVTSDRKMAPSVDSCVAQLRTFVETQGGRVAPNFLGQFYDLYPELRALFQPTARVFVETHGHLHHVVWQYDRSTNESTIVAEPRTSRLSAQARSQAQGSDAELLVIRKLHAFLVARGGELAAGSLQQFYLSTPSARSVMKPTAKAFVASFGDSVPGIRVQWVVARGQTSIVASTTITAATASRTSPQSNVEPWRKCLELLNEFVQQHPSNLVPLAALGNFCKQNPSVADILRPTKKMRSCQAFIDKYGQRDGFNLVWELEPQEGVRALDDSSDSSSSDQPTADYIEIKTVAEAMAVVKTKLQQADIMAIDLEGDLSAEGQFSLLQVAVPSSAVYIFDILACPAILSNKSVGLGALLSSPAVVKVIHDGRRDYEALHGQFGITLANVFDMQVAYCMLHNTQRLVGINVVLKEYTDHFNTEKGHVQHRPGLWNQRPLPANLLDYAAQDVQYTIDAYDAMSDEMDDHELRRCVKTSIDRMKTAAFSPPGSQPQTTQLPRVATAKTTPTSAKPATQQRLSSQIRQQASALGESKEGIVVVDKDPDAFSKAIDVNAKAHKVFAIKNTGSSGAVLMRVALVASSNAEPFYIPNPIDSPQALRPGQQVNYAVHFCSAEPGSFRAIVTFKLVSPQGNSIDIVRLLDNVNCVSSKTPEALRTMIQDAAKNSRRYKRAKERTRPGKVVDAYVHNYGFTTDLEIRIAEYKMPQLLLMPTKDAPHVQVLETNYVTHFQQMLWLEERQQHIDQQEYDMVGAVLQPSGRVYRLGVPGLAESRPSVLGGDKVLLVHKGKTFQARAVDVTRDEVVLGTPMSFSKAYQRNDRVDVRFCLSRVPMRLCHQGVVQFAPPMHRKFLFPTVSPNRNVPTPATFSRPLRWTQELNPEQMQAVRDLLNFDRLTAPYIIFGPPGTGKTTTLVESIVQIAIANPASRILMCAATNAAADLLVDRLSKFVATGRMLRVMGAMRKERDTMASVLPYTLPDGNGGFNVATLENLMKPSLTIVVATLGTGAKLYNYGIKRGYFDIVAVDEAGQATEPEIMSVLGPLANNKTALILAGDPQQLGPVIKSAAAVNGGFGISMLERLVQLPVYHASSVIPNARVITKLRRNYRAHPSLLTVPSSLFYESSLIACASAATCRGFENWAKLPKQGVPLIFHGVQGTDCQDANSPSWFNPQEIVAVDAYVNSLLSNGIGMARRVLPTDIGIITPYAKQRQKIHQVLKTSGIEGVRVGSVEQFQGAEMPVIIVTTVRSSRDFFDEDAKFNLGFLGNAKRFNVAITRAQSLLIVVGNPFVLGADPNWKALLQYCNAQGVWKGAGKPAEAVKRNDVIHYTSEEEAASCSLM